MRPGRIAVLAALPVLALLGSGRGTLPEAPTVAQELRAWGDGLAVRVVTDGHPRPVSLPARHTPAAVTSPPQVTAPRAAQRPAARPGPATGEAPRVEAAPVVPRDRPSTVADGYPYAADSTGEPDPWGFTKRQCVSYTAWRLAEVGRPLDNADGWGSALDWDDAARRLGHRVSSSPSVGAVAHWEAGEGSPYWPAGSATAEGSFAAGSYGHVAWVTRVHSDGSVTVAQYNGAGDRAFSTMRVRAPRYLQL